MHLEHGGLTGSTRVGPALVRWTLSYSLRTKAMLNIKDDDDKEFLCSRCTVGRRIMGGGDEGKMFSGLQWCYVLLVEVTAPTLQNIMN